MKKRLIIEAEENKKQKQSRIIKNRFFEWGLYMIGYSLVLIIMAILFKSLYISNEHYGLYALLSAIIIYILNQTIKPILFYITLPLTSISMGLFYPLINVLILYITSFILGDKFIVSGIFIPFIIAILISFMNILMEGLVIKPILKRSKNNE